MSKTTTTLGTGAAASIAHGHLLGTGLSDGENWDGDNEIFTKYLKNELSHDKVNFVGVTQIQCWNYQHSLNAHVEETINSNELDPNYVRTAYVGGNKENKAGDPGAMMWPGSFEMSAEDRAAQIFEAVKRLLGKPSVHQH